MSPVLKLDPKGTGETSSQEFARVVSDPSIQVVFLAKGRESAVRVLEDLEDENIDWNNAPPKVIVGSGRSTAILNGITLRTGLVTFLGCEPRVTEFSTYMSPFAQACFTRRFGPDSEPQTLRFSPPDPTSKEVVARAPSGGTTTVEGRLFGGDIHEFESLLLSGEGRSLAGAILVFESQGHSVNQFESAVWALKRAKVLQDCRAVILGDVDFTGGGKPDRMAAIAHVLNATQRCGIPVMHTGSFGPKLPGIFLPIGGTVTIDFNEGTIHIPRSCV
jgi:muramoyltetrapeptide carboxypeptidase LdcA involved in peptidoglycan recycling